MELAKTIGTRRYSPALGRIYPRLDNISVDYAIMEPATRLRGGPRVSVIPADVGWSDIGSWAAVYELLATKPGANVSAGPSFTLDAEGNYFWSPKKFVAAIGVRDLVLVETADALLLCSRERSQDVGKDCEMARKGRPSRPHLDSTGGESIVDAPGLCIDSGTTREQTTPRVLDEVAHPVGQTRTHSTLRLRSPTLSFETLVGCVQDSVQEGRGFRGGKFLCQLEGFIDGHLRRRGAGPNFIDRQTQDTAVDSRHALELPVFCEPTDELVDEFGLGDGAFK